MTEGWGGAGQAGALETQWEPGANQQFLESVPQSASTLSPLPVHLPGAEIVLERDWGWFLGLHLATLSKWAWSASDRAADLDASAEV